VLGLVYSSTSLGIDRFAILGNECNAPERFAGTYKATVEYTMYKTRKGTRKHIYICVLLCVLSVKLLVVAVL